MNKLAARLACISLCCVPFLGLTAFAQPYSLQAVQVDNKCMDVKITNHTNHLLVVDVSYHYFQADDGTGRTATHDWQTSTTVQPSSTAMAWTGSFAAAGPINCDKLYKFNYSSPRYEDKTAQAEETRRQYDDSTKQVIANELARQAEQKRQSDALMAKKQAEADARATQQAAQQAERDRQLQASRNLQAMQEAAKQQRDRNAIASGDPRCNSLTIENHNACVRNMAAQDERDRQARLAAQQQAKMDAEGRALGEQRSQKINSLISAINPETCVAPGFTAANEAERMQIQQTLAQGVVHCQQVALGRNASAQQQQAQIAAAQQQQALQQQQMIAAQQQAEYQAQMQQYAQQSMSDAAAGIQSSNNDMRQQAADIHQNNADLEAWLNSN